MHRLKKTRRPRKISTKWCVTRCQRLISLVESRPNLWDIRSHDYKSHKCRDLSWYEIAQEMQLPKEEASNKWNLLRQQFRNAFNKLKASTSDQEAAALKPPNEFYQAMLFLQPIINMDTAPRTSSSKISKDSEASMSSFGTPSQAIDIDIAESSADDSSDSANPALIYADRSDPLAHSRHDDEYDLWGKSVAATLRNYPDVIAVRMAKSKMNLVMAALEAGELDGPGSFRCKREFQNAN